jgi:hypothetical protein
MKPSGAHTHPSSDGGLPAALALIAVAAIAVAAAGPVVNAIAALLRAVILTGIALIAVAAAALLAFAVYRARHPGHGQPAHWMAGRAGPPHLSTAPRQAALGRPNPPVIHLHLHGTSPQDVAEVLARQLFTIDSQDGGDRHATP